MKNETLINRAISLADSFGISVLDIKMNKGLLELKLDCNNCLTDFFEEALSYEIRDFIKATIH